MLFIFIFLTLILILILSFKLEENQKKLPKFTFFIISIQALVLSLSLGFLFWKYTGKLPQKFSEPLSGNIAFEFQNKDSDILSIFFSILIFLISFLLLKKIYELLNKNQSILMDLQYFSLISIIPFFIMLGQLIKIENLEYLLIVSLFFVILDILSKVFLIKLLEKEKIKEEEIFSFFSYFYLIIIFSIFSSFGFSMFFVRINLLFLKNYILVLWFLILFSFYFFLKFKKKLNLLEKLKFLLFLSQLGTPFLLSIFLSPVLKFQDGKIGYLPFKNSLYFILILFAFFVYFDIFLRFIKKKEKFVSPLPLVLILIFLLSEELYWPFVLKDDFHGGHWYLPWFMLKEFGSIPFLDFQPAYGLINYFPGFFSFLFFDGTYSGIPSIKNLLSSIFIIILFFSLRSWISDFPAFLITFSSKLFFQNNLVLFPLGFSVFLFLLKLKLDKIFTFWLWFFSSLFIFFLNLPDGTPFLIGISPLGFYSFYKLFKNSRKKFLISISIFILLVIFISIFTGFDEIFSKELKYLYHNTKVNSIAQGIKWGYPEEKERITLGPLWQFVRFAWLFVFIPFIFLIYYKRKEIKENPKLFILLISLILICVFMIPRSCGRIDKLELSRPFVSNMLIIFWIPLIFFPFLNKKNKINFLLCFSFFLGVLGFQENSLRQASKLFSQKFLIQPDETISGKEIGIYSIGENVLMDSNQIIRQKYIKNVLDKLISKDETFYDCTNHISDYFFQGFETPVSNPTIYDISGKNQQIQILRELKKKNPTLILISAENLIFDGGNLPFRVPEIYFYFLENYVPFEGDGGYIWMIKKDETKRLENFYEIKDKKGQIELLNKAFFMKDLKGLPASWGASISSVSKNLIIELSFENINIVHKNDIEKKEDLWIIKGKDPYFVFEVLKEIKAEYLFIHLEEKEKDGKYQIFWTNDLDKSFREENSLYFDYSKYGKYLIPLYSSPSYQISSEKKYIRIDFQGDFENIKIKDISIYKRKN